MHYNRPLAAWSMEMRLPISDLIVVARNKTLSAAFLLVFSSE